MMTINNGTQWSCIQYKNSNGPQTEPCGTAHNKLSDETQCALMYRLPLG